MMEKPYKRKCTANESRMKICSVSDSDADETDPLPHDEQFTLLTGEKSDCDTEVGFPSGYTGLPGNCPPTPSVVPRAINEPDLLLSIFRFKQQFWRSAAAEGTNLSADTGATPGPSSAAPTGIPPCCAKNCLLAIPRDKLLQTRDQVEKLTAAERHMFLMGKLSSSICMVRTTNLKVKERSQYVFDVKTPVCQEAFSYAFNVGISEIQSLQKHLLEKGIETLVHKAKKRPSAPLEIPPCCPKNCLLAIPRDKLLRTREQAENLTGEERHMFLMGKLSSAMNLFQAINVKIKEIAQYVFDVNTPVCHKAFSYAFNAGFGQIQSLRKHLLDNGIETLVHKGTNRPSAHAHTESQVREVTTFIMQKAEVCGFPAPTENATSSRILLPAGTVKLQLWNEYRKLCEAVGWKPVSETSFRNIWKRHLKHVKIVNPRTDLYDEYGHEIRSDMPSKCCASGCDYGLDSYVGPKRSVHKFPTHPKIRYEWTRRVRRVDFEPTPNSALCSAHFDERYIVKFDTLPQPDGSLIQVPRQEVLTKDAVPTIFAFESTVPSETLVVRSESDVPANLSSAVRKRRRNPDERRKGETAEIYQHKKILHQTASSINAFSDVVRSVNDEKLIGKYRSNGWTVKVCTDTVIICKLDWTSATGPFVERSLEIGTSLHTVFRIRGTKVKISQVPVHVRQIHSWEDICAGLQFIDKFESRGV